MPDIVRITATQPRHVGRDFCAHLPEIHWGKSIAIVGTGPGVVAALTKLPAVDYVIAVNGAIAIPYPFQAWAAMDTAVPDLDYAKDIPPSVDCYLGASIAQRFERCSYTFKTDVNTLSPCPMHVVRGDSTIAGAALNMAYQLNQDHGDCELVYLLGCPMKGGYWTGESSYQEQVHRTPGIDWAQTEHFNSIIAECERWGMRVYHIGETNLRVKQI